ncbi:MAG: hypothetical protein ACR2OR_11290 [Hyphomicrobiales bacterium]
MSLTFEFAPLVSEIWLALLGFAALAIVILGILLRARGALLRALAMAAVFLAILNPVARDEARKILPDVAVVVSDLSTSQRIDNRDVRATAAREEVDRILKNLPDLTVKTVTVNPSDLPEDEGTQLFRALNEALGDVPPERFAGTIMITDGQVHDVPDTMAAQGYNGPVHALITGRKNERDRRLVIEQAPQFAIVGQKQVIRLRVDDQNTGETTARLSISIDGGEPEQISIPVGTPFDVPITIAHGGNNITGLEVNAVDGELTELNNRAVVLTRGIRDRLRVLLVSGQPHAGERTWRNLLKSDAAVDLVHFTILRPPEKQDTTPIVELSLIAFPTRELFSEKLNDFDLIIFDRYQRRDVLPMIYLANVAEYVEDGGAVLTAAGPAFATPLSLYRTPLSAILPSTPTGGVQAEPFKPVVTERGARHPVTGGLPGGEGPDPQWGRWFRLIDVVPKQGDIVMSGTANKPLMILDRRGKGRVAQLLSDHAWLWARGYEGGGPQAELLRRLAHWLMKEPDLEEEALRGIHKGRALTIERRTLEDTTPDVTITSPSGAKQTLKLKQEEPGQWRARVAVSEPGIHRLTDGILSAVAAVGSSDPKEMAEITASTAKLEPILSETGGRAFWVASGEESVSLPTIRQAHPGRRMAGPGWLALRRNGAYRVESLKEYALFSSLLALAALLFLLGLAWYREGR